MGAGRGWRAALSALLFAPVLAWNAAHGWASFAKQGGRAGDWQPARALQFIAELVGGQVGLATPLVAVMLGAGIALASRQAWRTRLPGWTLLAALTVVPAAVFAEHAFGDRVQANWPSVLYPAASVAAAGLAGGWRRLRAPAIGLGLAITLLVWVQSADAPLALPRAIDPTLMRVGGWRGLAGEVAASARQVGATYVVSDNYGHAGLLARLLPPDLAVLGLDARWALFALPGGQGVVAGRVGLLVRSARRDDAPDRADWSELAPLGEVVRSRDGVTAETFRLFRVVGRPDDASASDRTALAVMPRPR